jgi:hypothetical protein
MILRNRLHDRKTVIRLGMLCLLLFFLANWFLHPATAFWQGWVDEARGVLLGLGIGFNLWAVRLASRPHCGMG